MRRLIQVPVLATLLLLVCASAAAASTITVTRTDDPTGDQNCLGADTSCSLRQAINAENGTETGGDVIVLSAGTYSLTQGTDIIATKPFDLEGNGVGSTTIDGSQNKGTNAFGALARILRVDSSANGVVIQDLSFTGGFDEEDENCPPGNCQVINENGGGDLFNNGGNVTLDHVAFINNFGSATPLGGAVSNGSGTLTMNNVSFTHDAGGVGGGLFTRSGTINGNGITFQNDATTCCDGGAAYLLGGTVTLVNSTIVNSGGFDAGGAIANGGAVLTLDNVTMSDNGADIQTDPSGTTNVENTILGTGASGGVACVAPGRIDSLTNARTVNAITNDGGENIAQDNSCNLSGSGDKSNADPRLAPIFDNGGPTLTEALLNGSPALQRSITNCPQKDQRGISRGDGNCDIGAFEAVIKGAPTTPSTGQAQNITDTAADLTGTINLDGEAGGFHFLYGTAPDNLSSTSPEAAAGVVSADDPVLQTISGLSPDTTYYYKIVADNASNSTPANNVQQFTTAPGPPIVQDVMVQSVTDSTTTIRVTIDPQGADTTYVINYGPDTGYGQHTSSVDIGSTPGQQQLHATLSGLNPASQYHFDVVATNSAQPDGVASNDQTFTTDQQIAGAAGSPVMLSDGGVLSSCPTSAGTVVDWGDGAPTDHPQISCMPDPMNEGEFDYHTTDTHTYASPGHYRVQISYNDLESSTEQYAQISDGGGGGSPTVTGVNPSSGPTGGGTGVTISGTNLTGATAVNFGAAGATNVAVVSATEITATSPPGWGTVDVTVSTPHGTSPTGAPDRFTYNAPPPPRAQSSPPSVAGGAPTSTTVNGASVSGTVNPDGASTQAYFQYGLDLGQRGPGSDATLYDQSTPSQQVGSDTTNHTVTAPLTGLIPGALYHVRLVATNADGTTFGQDQTFTAAQAPAPPPPVLGQSEDVKPVSGTVFIKTKNGQFIPLTGATQIPNGSVIDALHGSLQLIAALGKGKTETGTFGGAIFKLTQAHNGLVTLKLIENAFKGAPSYALCKAHKAADPTATAASSKTLQLLRASAHGKFRTTGRYSAATVRGTTWTIADRCDGTLVHDITHSVAVTDFVRHKTIVLHAGQSYLAKP